MADDLAFVFSETPRRRPSDSPPAAPIGRSQPHAAAELPTGIQWKTLREAHTETSIPVSTLRKWAKRGKIRARLVRDRDKELRLVAYEDVVDRAAALEREVHPTMAMPRAVASTPRAVSQPAAAEPEAPSVGATGQAPEGSILVPLDAWDRMLGQLGNLHEAGQQLAEARERAAKAETESEFLKERLRDMRRRAEQAELALDLQRIELPEAPAEEEPVLQIGWRRFRSRWLGR
ncbi:MAG: hypothetical protein HKN74_06325 [Acidimicrobiia bacterium]|nr:hypothetical protein [Acidimicrobiia bacterium]MBT8216105.1 hypothetical protein [Acidimicrobiia bacterium]NNF09884.1 hypothetical protein [Acidimicrobiia bacterium]NNL70511.1 hypothetical protein [Acidimicrobiia bacterium]